MLDNAAIYDAWNRLVAVKDGANFVARYAYDGLTRRTVKQAYDSSGTLTETRHCYFSDQWQIVREMVSGSTAALYIWGLRYVDELLVRYDPTYGRKYAMQDANFNCTSICGDASTGSVDERYQYDPYAGNRIILDASWNVISASANNWTVGHQGLMFEAEVGIYNCRNRVYLPILGTWMQRDPIGYADGGNLYEYVGSAPSTKRDPNGFGVPPCVKQCMSCIGKSGGVGIACYITCAACEETLCLPCIGCILLIAGVYSGIYQECADCLSCFSGGHSHTYKPDNPPACPNEGEWHGSEETAPPRSYIRRGVNIIYV